MATKHNPNETVTVRLSECDADINWNARREEHETAPDTTLEKAPQSGFEDLVYAIAKRGQEREVVMRPHPTAGQTIRGRKSQPYFLCSGFRRWRAITEIAAGKHDQLLANRGMLLADINKLHTDKPTILAHIRDLDDKAARLENIRENTQREALNAPDVAFGMADLRKIDKSMTIEQMANELGLSPSYAGKLWETYSGLSTVPVPVGHKLNADGKKEITLADVWRNDTVKPKKDDVLGVANLTKKEGDTKVEAAPEDKLAKYLEVRDRKAGGGTNRGPGAWVKNAVEKHAVTIGKMLGNLARDGAITVIAIESKHVETLLRPLQTLPTKEVHDEQRAKFPNADPPIPPYNQAFGKIAAAINAAVTKGLQPPVTSEEGDATTRAATTDGIPSPPEEGTSRSRKNGRAAVEA